MILLLFFSQWTPLHYSTYHSGLEIARLLVESKADVAARSMCFSPPPSHHLSLTICLAAAATLHSKTPSSTTKPTLLHTCAASARRYDAPPRAATAPIKAVLVRVAAAVWGWGVAALRLPWPTSHPCLPPPRSCAYGLKAAAAVTSSAACRTKAACPRAGGKGAQGQSFVAGAAVGSDGAEMLGVYTD